VTLRRRAGAPRLIEWTGERCVPWTPDVQVIYEHVHRYLWAAPMVRGRRVLDLGSGEGFGAALLSESAAHVVGVDIDEQTIDHSRLNYAGPNLEFELGSALDLTAFEDASFGAVVAFEIVEHVVDHDRVLLEVARILSDDGILVMSTPDRRMYSDARTDANPFHKRELTFDEFKDLLGEHFAHVALWGQRTITGSHLDPLDPADDGRRTAGPDFFIERSGDEWRLARVPAPMYCVAVASRSPLPRVGAGSTLADCGLELMRVKERDTLEAIQEKQVLSLNLEREKADLLASLERERDDQARIQDELRVRAQEQSEHWNRELSWARDEIVRSQETVARTEDTINALRGQLSSVNGQLGAARQASRRTEESVTWQAFQRSRGRLYRVIGGERSLVARLLGMSLRFVGRRFGPRPVPSGRPEAAAPDAQIAIQMPGCDAPQVSLIVPLHAHAALTEACLRSIRDRTAHVRYEVILVDDTADVETKRLLDRVHGAKILRNETNLGYLRSVNRGASVARGEWLVIFNNDTEVTHGWLPAMLDCARSASDVGVVTPKFIYPNGTLNEAGGIIWRDGTGVNYGRGDAPDRFQYEYRRETDYGSAAALMVRADLWNTTGGFDERYLPMYYEDTDLCFQAREHGLRVLYEPHAVVVHIEGATAGNDLEAGYKRFQEKNRKKFVTKWRAQLEAQHRYPAVTGVRAAADRHRGEHVLVVDHRVPMWDRDSGSLRMLRMMEALIALGTRVSFMPDNLAQIQPYTRDLQRMGIEVLYGQFDVNTELAAIGPTLTTAILCRPHATSHWLDAVREFAPAATVAYDTVDLHWLREARKTTSLEVTNPLAGSNGGLAPDELSPKARALRELELAMIRATDLTLVVSDRERSQVERDVPGARVLVVPNVHDIEPVVSPPEHRSGILFVGGFEHPPNVDAAVRLVNEVMPPVWSDLGNVRVTIVGSNPPPEVQALASPLVEITGWVEDLQPLLNQSRVMVAPLRYGAGLKGKVTQSLAVGLPVVTTPIGAEGLGTAAGDDVASRDAGYLLIGDDATSMASETVRVYRDHELWWRLSRAGQEVIAARCSKEVVTRRLSELVRGTSREATDDADEQAADRDALSSARGARGSGPEPHPA
jgi:O-antigen biosynthesis protein